MVAPAFAALVFSYETTLELDRGAGGKTLPTAVAVDPVSGDVCVTDSRQTTLQVFNNRNVWLCRTERFAGVQWPASGAIAPDGTLVFTDTEGGEGFVVRHLDLYGEPAQRRLAHPGGAWSPRLISVTAEGDLLSLDEGTGRLVRHDGTTGAILWTAQVGDANARDSRFGRPQQGPDGRVFVPGGDQRRVFVFSADGSPAGSFGKFGSAVGRMSLPVGVAFGPGGEILVLDRLRGKILVFSPELVYQSEFGSVGARQGQLYHPADIASGDGRIYVAQGFLGRVQVFRVTDSQERRAESAEGSTAAGFVDRTGSRGAGTSDRAATRPQAGADSPRLAETQQAVLAAADRSLKSEAEQ